MHAINQSILDDSVLTDEQPSRDQIMLDPIKEDRTGKFNTNDLLANSPDKGKNVANAIKQSMAFGDDDSLSNDGKDNDFSIASKQSIENLSAKQIDVLSAQLNREQYYALEGLRTNLCFVCLVAISIVNTMQRCMISNMAKFTSSDPTKAEDPHYNIVMEVNNFTAENFNYIAGDVATIIYAFMVLFAGSATDLMNRKKVLLTCCFCWSLTIYLSSFATEFWHIFVLRLIMSLFNALSGPCSYSLMTDWIPPERRTMAYAIFALGCQFGGPVSNYNTDIIEWLGWRAAFQFSALSGFCVLAVSVILFDEPERGRFDISHSVMVNPEDSMKNDDIGYDLSEGPTRKRLVIETVDEQTSSTAQYLREYFRALKELFTNDAANWVLLAACLRTQQGIAMNLFTNQYFLIYEKTNNDIDQVINIAGLVGSFFCTLATAYISDKYDNISYMTKAYICMGTTMISIPCCAMIYLCNTNYWVSITGLFIEYVLTTGWSQPAIGMLSTVCDPSVRGTAISVFFFLITMFGVVAPKGYNAIQEHYGLDPYEEPREFGILIACCTIIPCVIAIPCFYICGVKYSWYKYHEAMFMLDVWGELEQWYMDNLSKKKLMLMNHPGDPTNLSVSVDWKQLKNERKMKIKDMKKDNMDLAQFKPTMKKRKNLIKDHDDELNQGLVPPGLIKKKTIQVDLQGDETINEFPDTTSAVDDQSYVFQQYPQSYDNKDKFLYQ